MARQAGILVGVGAVIAAAVAGVLFLVLSEPTSTEGPGTGTPVAKTAEDEPAEATDDGARGGRRHARVPGAATLFGVVRRADEDRPAAAQAVRVVGASIGTIEVATDASGAFRFDALPPGGPYAVEIDAAGYAPIRLPGIALDRSEERDLGTLLLDLAVRVEVHVADMAGEPLAAAEVSAYAAPQPGPGFDWSKAMAQMGQEPVAVAHVATGADGVAVFEELASGSWTFVARKDGYAATGRASVQLRSRAAADAVRLYLQRGHTLTGRVLDENENPVAGALVMGGGANAWDLGAAPLRSRSTTGPDGVYTLVALGAGDVPLFASPPGASPAQVVTLRIPDVTTFDIHLRSGGLVQGRVTMQEGGEPVEGVRVRAMTWGPTGTRTAEAVTDAEGRYAIAGLPEGSLGNVTAEKEGLTQVTDGQQQWTQNAFRAGTVVEKEIQMAPGAVLTGQVRGPDGPVTGARVVVMHQSGNGGFGQAQATTDADGRYRIDTLPPGPFLVQANAEGLFVPDFPTNWWMALQNGSLPEHLSGTLVAGDELERDIELRAGTAISGRVETTDGKPVAGATVRVAAQNGWAGGAGGAAVSAEDGTFRVEGIAPVANVQLFASASGLAQTEQKVLDLSGGTALEGQVIVLQTLPIVRGRVTASTGEVPDDAYVQVIAGPDPSVQNFVWDPSMASSGAERHPVRRDGSYEVTIPFAQGAFSVMAGAPGLAAQTSPRQKLEEGRLAYEADVELGDGWSLTGRVTSDMTGQGIAGAHVRVASAGGNDMGVQNVMMMGDVVTSTAMGGGGGVVVAVTDETGAFQVAGLGQGNHKVTAVAEGFVQGTIDAHTPSTGQLSLPLAPELEIAGVVVFGDGTPVEGVMVTAASSDAAATRNNPGFFPMGGAGAAATSDAAGAFVIRGLKRGQYVLNVQNTWGGRANVQPFASVPTAAGATDVRLVVQAGLRIAGRVVDESGAPVRQCWVWGNPVKPPEGRPQQPVNAQVKPDGTFEIVGLPHDVEAYTLTFNAQGMGGGLTPVTIEKVKPGTTGLEVVMKAGLKIEGKVLDTEGKPLGQAWLSAQPVREEGETTPRNGGNAMLEADGSFTIAGLLPGRYTLQVQAMGGPMGARQLVLEGGQEVAAGTTGLRLTATPGATITGVVVDESGRGVPNANVVATPPQGGRAGAARTAQDGSFEIGGLAEGTAYTVLARAAGRINAMRDGVTPGTTGLRLEVKQGATVDGTAADADGQPLAQTWMYLRAADRPELGQQNTRTDEQGAFSVGGLEEGATYEVTARIRKDGTWTTLKMGTVRAGDTGVRLRAER